jgi:hypothetical protein
VQPISPDEIKHFLVTLDVASGEVNVQSFDTDYDAAQDAYAEAERANMDNSGLDIVLLGADSLETIQRTHSSYFNNAASQLEKLLSG